MGHKVTIIILWNVGKVSAGGRGQGIFGIIIFYYCKSRYPIMWIFKIAKMILVFLTTQLGQAVFSKFKWPLKRIFTEESFYGEEYQCDTSWTLLNLMLLNLNLPLSTLQILKEVSCNRVASVRVWHETEFCQVQVSVMYICSSWVITLRQVRFHLCSFYYLKQAIWQNPIVIAIISKSSFVKYQHSTW